MKKLFIITLLSILVLNISSQESRSNFSERKMLDRGIELHKQQKYAISNQYLNNFLKTLSPAKNNLLQEAEYYIACNSFHTKSKDAFSKLEAYCANYPYSPMINRIYFMIGKMHYDKKEYAKTLKYYKRFSNSDLKNDESNEYLYARGFSHLALKEYKDASRYFLPLTGKNQPYETDATYYYGYSEFCQDNFDRSLEAFAKVDSASKYFEPTCFHILQIYDKQNKLDKAIEQGEKLLKLFPSSKYRSEAFRILGESSYRNENWEKTVSYLSKYCQLEKVDQRANIYMLGYAQFKTENYKNSAATFGRVTSEKDSLAQHAYLYIGYSNLRNKQLKQAQMAFQSASLIDLNKTIREEAAYNYTMAAYQNNSPFGETVAAFERFINEYPNSLHLDAVYSTLASVFMNEKDYVSALNSINKIKTKNTKIRQAKENALFQIGVQQFIKGNYPEAMKNFDLSIKEYTSASFSAQAFLWKAETHLKLEEKNKCRKYINLYLEKFQPKTPDNKIKAYYTLGYLEFEAKNYMEAKKWFTILSKTKGADKNRVYTDVLNRLADCHYNNRDFEAARRVYASVPPKSPVADYAAYQNAFILGIQKKYTAKIDALETLVKNYKRSGYADDAIYEIGRTYVILENYDKAIEKYTTLQKEYAKSPYSRKAALEIGMLYANMDKTNQAISAFKKVIEKYPSSEETRVALESLQSLYVELNQVEDYLVYRESITGTSISSVAKNEQDSLSFIAAERVFEKQNYKAATKSLTDYIYKYCDSHTLNCISAMFYLAESHYALNEMDNALTYYDKVINKEGNPHMETALLKGAEIAYDKGNYSQANEYFSLLKQTAEIADNITAARLGQLRCSFKSNSHIATINIANEIVSQSSNSPTSHIREARYCRAKANIAAGETPNAVGDLQILGEDLQYEMGAEATVLLANHHYQQKEYEQSEAIITKFIEKNSPHQYWIARSFILLADIYIAQNDDFMAKQYLMSLSQNYSQKEDDISEMITQRLNEISQREAETVM